MATKCPKCYAENPEIKQFCGDCGTKLTSVEEAQPTFTKTLEIPTDELTRGTLFADRYEIIEELGSGGMGKVYRVEDKKIGEEVALKLIRPEISIDRKTIERFNNELRIARKIRHKNVCGMYDLGEEKGKHFITMEYVPGEDLKSLLKRVERLDPGTAIKITNQVCDGLAEAHRLDVVHRDLKPSNIMIDKDGNAKIMDFGIARSSESTKVTGTGTIIGTPEYMSPEQAEAEDLDKRSDIYSLGIILFEMVTGHVPFTGRSQLSVALKHKSEAPPDPKDSNPQVQDDLSRIILKCLEKTKEDRYVSAEELKADLKEIAGQLPTTQRKIKKRKTITAKEVTVTLSPKKLFMPGLVLLAAAIVIVLLWHPWKQKTIIPSASGKPTLAVLFFQNSTGEKELDTWSDAITRMLIAHLTQSRYIKVLPDDRIFSIMKRLNLLESANYTTEDLRQIAEMGAVSHLIKGYFTKSPESFRIYFSVQESGSMEVVGSGYVEADNVGKIISMADELSPKIKDFLNLSEAQIRSDKDVSVAELMTSSADALMHYNEGIRQAGNLGFGKALKSFEKAVDLDPDFAMAYLNISALYFHARKTKEGQESLMKAVELKENASEWEQHVIDGYFYEREGNFVKAIESLKKVLEVVPEHRFSLTMLGFIYQDIGDYENAIKYWEKYNEYYPEEERGIYNLFTQYLYMGYFDKARELLERYPENFSDQMPRSLIECYVEMGEWDLATALADKYYEKYRHARHLRGNIYFYRDDFLMAEAEYKKNSITFRLDFIPIVRGRYRDAAERFLTNIVKAREEGKSPVLPSLVFLTHILLQMGQPEKALEEIEIALEIDESPENLFWKGMVQIHLGSVSEALLTAEKIKRKVEQSLMKGDMRFYHLLMAMIEKENRNYDKAIDFSQRALSLTSYWGLHYRNLYVDTLASSYYLKNDLEKARIEYEKSISLTGARFWLGDIYVKSYYMLGKIHEQQGKKTKAKEYYEKFLDLWHSADPGIAEVEDARSRLASLQVP